MVTLTRSLIRQLRSVYRRVGIKPKAHRPTYVVIQAGAAGLTILAKSPEVVVEYLQPCQSADERLIVPLDFLADCEGSKDDSVTLEAHGADKVVAKWTDKNIPQLIEYQSPKAKDVPTFSEPPASLTENEPKLWQVLNEASQCTDDANSRYALGYIQLRSKEGRVAATDGRQLFAQSGFQFPWPGDALVPGTSVFASRDIPQDQPVLAGKSGDWLTLAVGPWTFRFSDPLGATFPKLDDFINQSDTPYARLEITPADAEFLIESVPRLPSGDAKDQPITVDLNGKVVVRAKSATDPTPTELVATNSHLVGKAMMLNTNREFLVRALRLGFREIGLTSPTSPVRCVDGDRRYVWMLLEPHGFIKADDKAVRIESPPDTVVTNTQVNSLTRRPPTVSHNTNESTTQTTEKVTANKPTIHRPKQDEHASPIEQVIVLRTKLREAVNQTNELIRSLKRQKKQSRLLTTTLASLKELQKVAG